VGLETFRGTLTRAASQCRQAAQASRVRRLTWPLEFGLPSLCATISLLCGSARRNCSRLIVYHAPTRPAVGPGSMDRAVLRRRPVRLVAGLRRARLCCNSHRICLLLRGDAAVRRSRSSGIPLRTLWSPGCLLAGCSYLPCISDLRDWNKYFCIVSSWCHRGHYRRSTGARCPLQPGNLPVPGRTISRLGGIWVTVNSRRHTGCGLIQANASLTFSPCCSA